MYRIKMMAKIFWSAGIFILKILGAVLLKEAKLTPRNLIKKEENQELINQEGGRR